ncbi:orotidine-5'-phosphate decarboxylase [Caloramator fervidus]|uniref:Orotidine 5'-phosphate decarboxylase n=1 Tax=Caloramator fervidus TaxID=29344 RepID=A0A1H5RTD6_9CLOT|nr:orotidine-5'-phosphate decarboxylase [Caloramator fervidus]SEF41364.1 orotidine-5'-phosphate decarboxylase [Caloramator fervidus]
MIIDKLYEAVEKKGPVCVGLDTSIDYIPKDFLKKFTSLYDALFEFNKRIIDATEDIASCFKIQIAYYEALGIEGMKVYSKTVKYLRSRENIVIGDIKRSDILDTAKMYAKAHFEGDFEVDLVTLNPYMGMDSIIPFLEYLDKDKGIFVLVKTSNPSSKDLQTLYAGEKRVFERVYDFLKPYIESNLGRYGYSPIGAVVGCTNFDEAEDIRKNLKGMFFLIPGYGAQGGKKEDVKKLLMDGNGGVVNSSRAILLAYKKYDDEFFLAARKELLRMKEEILSAI